jgi:hypothetical protein
MSPLAARRFESLQAEYLTSDDPEIRQAVDLEISERLGRDLLGTVLVAIEKSPKADLPSTEAIVAAINVLRGAIAQERAWASYANDGEAQAEADRLTAVVEYLKGGAHG